jgi:hypothetical protein
MTTGEANNNKCLPTGITILLVDDVVAEVLVESLRAGARRHDVRQKAVEESSLLYAHMQVHTHTHMYTCTQTTNEDDRVTVTHMVSYESTGSIGSIHSSTQPSFHFIHPSVGLWTAKSHASTEKILIAMTASGRQ